MLRLRGPLTTAEACADCDDSDDDTEVVKKATMPAMRWEDVNYQRQTLKALNKMRKSKQFCDVTLRVSFFNALCHSIDIHCVTVWCRSEKRI